MYYEDFNIEDYDGNWEFNKIINDIIGKEVDQRVVDIREGYERNKLSLKEYQDNLWEVKNALYNFKNNQEKELKQIIKQTRDDVKREIFGGYKINDKVYIIKTNPNNQKCTHCKNGKIEVVIDNIKTTAKCPYCSYGSIITYTYEPQKGKISQVNYKEWAEERCKELEYWVKPERGDSKKLELEDIYKTEEECQVACTEKHV